MVYALRCFVYFIRKIKLMQIDPIFDFESRT